MHIGSVPIQRKVLLVYKYYKKIYFFLLKVAVIIYYIIKWSIKITKNQI